MYTSNIQTQSLAIRSEASNIRPGAGTLMSYEDFIALYPQFGPTGTIATPGPPLIPQDLVEMYLDLASHCLSTTRWRSYWKTGTGFFVAHFATLYLMSMSDPNFGASAVVSAAESRGIVSSESASDVSASYDVGSVVSGLESWAGWKLTLFGIQLATIGKMVGAGGMMV